MIQKKQILVVEDNMLNRAILSEILRAAYEVLEAENGLEALEVLRQYKDSVALILLDVMMPVMDGYTFLDRIRDDAELSLIPVIVTTQSDGEEDEVTALSHGATDFVPKPYRPQVILHRVASLIKLRETAAMVNQFQYDRLTGLYSKEFFYQKVRERLQEDPEQDYSIVCSNIENFKLVNDIFGVREGDRMLQEVAGIAQNVVGSDGFCGRFNADRFLCLQKREKEQQDRMNFGKCVEYPVSAMLKNVVMRWGIYEITDRTVPVEQMCDRAMLAANSIKGKYNQFFTLYDDSLRDRLLREQAITDAMGTALEQKQFIIYYQPKYSLNDNCMAGAEALVRWIHPEWGFLSPGEFIPLFEKNGFISHLDRYVWENVCAQLRAWKEEGRQLLPVSVNVSRADVYQGHLVETLRNLTEKYRIDPSYLHLEITESVYADNSSQLIRTVEELRSLGFPIEMDDFGSGYSSLNMLSQMTLDILKLDMKFIQNEVAKPVDRSILNDVISMAHRMHLNVVAEGVETREQMNRLRALGCDYIQGYFFAKPMPAAEFETLWEKQAPCLPESPEHPLTLEPGLNCLLVADEDGEYRRKVHQTFAGQYQVLEASDAESAVSCLRSVGADRISAVVLSVTLPGKGAAAVLKYLRQQPALWKLPVLAVIPEGKNPSSLPLSMETDDFYCKDHPMEVLHRRIHGLIEAAASQERENTLQAEANRDQLTGLLNRRGLQTAMSAIRKEELPLAVYLFDLDNLKVVNDNYGHHIGDKIIRDFSEVLRRNTRMGDILCRYGGDEFLVILRRLGDSEIAVRKGEAVCEAFQSSCEKEEYDASCSVGVVICNPDETPSAELFERADYALYCAKRKNKGGCCQWNYDCRETE